MSTIRRALRLAAAGCLLLVCATDHAVAQTERAPQAKTVSFGGTEYLHRWSKDGQNEYTPSGQEDLAKWTDMVTINVHESAKDGDQLAGVANAVVANYQRAGKIIRTDSQPRTDERPAEHFVVAVLSGDAVLEVAFARIVLIDGVGFVVVYSHRAYGAKAAAELGPWLQTNGYSVETVLMAWDGIPALPALKQLPQSARP